MPFPPLIKPPRLAPGDIIGLIAPAGVISQESIDKSVAHVEALGFRVRLGAHLTAVHGNYAGLWAQRMIDFNAMFRDPEVKAIWAIRGGSGALQLLPHIDYQMVRAHPKILIGYSDLTALHLAINRHAGLVTFHGPLAMSTPSDYATKHLLDVLMDPRPQTVIPMAAENAARATSAPQFTLRTVVPGVATGRLTGGNLSLVAALAGTPYATDIRGSLLFLEDVNEEPYRIDRMLMQLQMNQPFSQAAGVMLGVFEGCGPAPGESALTLDETTDQHLRPLKIPAVTGWSFGHIRDQFTLPMGVQARLETAAQTLTLLEPAVS
ncbi:LD-carboxypeptidase [Pseudoduganella plicata]|uniref:LD-carboxypeptidase n=1 Tax=Pseudoduganella plicata TaxID=321984 RepID=A0A4P7BH70_9BURK|nr:LD-carboxypeptidase [Pseudoduganella plicata]QBQ37622.1 LD-carboxypeptidase [Pseudoduganella plicata]GGY91788.1 peptidase U61 [Pseudoduganella plicata]